MKKRLKTIAVLPVLFATQLYGIEIDGKLDDEEWLNASLITDFVIIDPFSLGSPEYKTEGRIFTNEDGIYIGITNFQPKSTQKSERSARDSQIAADRNTIVIDFDNSAIAGYSFEVGNGGSMRDGIWRNETSFSAEWNGVWSMQTSSDEEHWYSEVFIPWDVSPMVDVNGTKRSIGLHISRFVEDLSKTYANSGISDSRQRFLSEFPVIAIDDYAGSSVQIFAYATGRQDRVASENSYDAGIDLFWKPNSSKQLSLSINPDFGQVESDDLVVNFSPTETFFSENRPFFTENQAIFDISGAKGLRTLHTRRIGGKPDIGDEIRADISAALKFTSVGDNFNYGFFSAIEDSDQISDGRNYYAGRAVRKTDNYSIGYLLTYADRPDIDRDAMVQSVDYSYYFSQNLQIKGQVIHSNITTPAENMSGNAAWIKIEQQVTPTWNQSLEISRYGDKFEVNDLGFLGRNDLETINYSTSWQNYNFSDKSIVKDHNVNVSFEHEKNTQGDHLGSSINITDSWSFKNTSTTNVSVTYTTSGIDDLLTRGNGNVKVGSEKVLDAIYFMDSRNKFGGHFHSTIFDRPVGGQGFLVHAHPSYQFNDNYLLTFGVTYTDSDDWLIWQGGDQLNSYKEKRLSTTLDLTATILSKHEFSLKFEWIALQAEGKNSYRVSNNENLSNLNTVTNDFSLSDVAIQLRYRYEISPLSNIYVVYSRGGRATIEEESAFSSLFTPGWDARDGDNLIVKVRYQF